MVSTRHLIMLGVAFPSIALLSGCAAIGTSVSHRNLQIQTQMSRSVFLDPVPNRDKSVYLQLHNTSGRADFRIRGALRQALEDKGYHIAHSYNRGYYLLQVNIRKVGRTSRTAAQQMMGAGYGGTLEGVVAGAAIGSATGNNAIAGGIIGGVASTIINNSVKNVTYTAVADVRVKVYSHPPSTHHTRIVSTANQVNLNYSTAMPALENHLVNSISGIF